MLRTATVRSDLWSVSKSIVLPFHACDLVGLHCGPVARVQ